MKNHAIKLRNNGITYQNAETVLIREACRMARDNIWNVRINLINSW